MFSWNSEDVNVNEHVDEQASLENECEICEENQYRVMMPPLVHEFRRNLELVMCKDLVS